MKKVMHLLNTSEFSGAENVVITIIKNMSSEFSSVYVSRDGSIRDVLKNNDIEFLPIKSMSVRELKKAISEYNPDIIHAHDFTASIVCALTMTKVPVVSHLHNNVPWLKKYHIYSFVYLLSSLKYKKILVVSNSIFQEYVFNRLIRKKTKVMSNPIDANNIKRKAELGEKEQYDIVFLGRLAEQKDPLGFIDLMNRLIVKIPNLKVAMIGTGALEEECRSKIIKLKLNENIKLLGFMNNPYGILAKSKVLCMTSKWEGFGLVAAEALCLGVPVVATPVGGLVGIVNDSCGLLTFQDQLYIDEVEKLIIDNRYWSAKSQEALNKSLELDNISEYTKKIKNIYETVSNTSLL